VSDLDVLNMTDVIVLGSAVVPDSSRPTSTRSARSVKIRGRRFTVIGILNNIEGTGMQIRSANARGSGGAWRWRNSGAFIPVSTALVKYNGNDRLTGLGLRIDDPARLRDAVEQTERTMLAAHKGLRDFSISTNEQTLEDFRKTEAAFKLSLGGVAGISLFVGGIGIMNVMLASINERIREIGVRKAVGARGSDLFLQFLAEAAVVSVVGGLLGLLVSVGIVSLMNFILTQALPTGAVAALDWVIMAEGLAFSVVIGPHRRRPSRPARRQARPDRGPASRVISP
jgi:ABC-type antimicrobial peptide transport system permease subunit